MDDLNDIPESPVTCPSPSQGTSKGGHHINGMTKSDTTSPTPSQQRVPPPVPPKHKRASKEEPLSGTMESNRLQELEKEILLLKDKLANQEKLKETQEEELETLRQQNREGKKREKRLQHKNDRYENTMKARRVSVASMYTQLVYLLKYFRFFT